MSQGMAVSNYKADKAEADKNRKKLMAIIKLPENQVCSDCPAKCVQSPNNYVYLVPLQLPLCTVAQNAWASINLGCFICFQCSGIHRNLGTHLSKACYPSSNLLDAFLLSVLCDPS